MLSLSLEKEVLMNHKPYLKFPEVSKMIKEKLDSFMDSNGYKMVMPGSIIIHAGTTYVGWNGFGVTFR